jgi:hypothetical protein
LQYEYQRRTVRKESPGFYFVALYERGPKKRSPLKALGDLTPAEFEAQ